MGMSASQARYIQLTARMSDLELEGQQINQQRLNLANQSSAIQEQALKMPVPTAPSTYDYMEPVYEGTDSDGNKVKAGSPSGGKLPVSTLSKDPINSMAAGNNTADSKPGVKEGEVKAPAKTTSSIKATYTPEKGPLKGYDYENGSHTEEERTKDIEDRQADVDASEEPKQSDYQKDVDDYDSEGNKIGSHKEDDTVAYRDAHRDWEIALQELQTKLEVVQNATSFDYYELDEGATAEATSTDGSGDFPAKYHQHGIDKRGAADGSPVEYSYTNALGKESKGDAQALKDASSGYSKDQIDGMINKKPQLFTDQEGNNKLSEKDFDEKTGKLKEGIKLYEEDEQHENIGGSKAYDLGEVNSAKWANGDSDLKNVKDLVQAINNFEANATGRNGIADSAELAKWRITQDANGGLHAFKIGDDGKATEYSMQQTQGAGWNTSQVDINEADFDENGVSNVPLGNGKSAFLSKSEQLNTTAYQAAEAEYKNKKAAYDHAQEEANQKVKKLQQIDKQLELKLKRLDTERNALNTEIDAVKKVIQDNTDKSFKTFSG